MLVEWEGGEHSVLAGKYAVGGCFEDGEEIVVNSVRVTSTLPFKPQVCIMISLHDTKFPFVGSRTHCCEVQSKMEQGMEEGSHDDGVCVCVSRAYA